MKKTIKNIPILGFLTRWLNNLLRLNNLKFKTVVLEEEVKVLKEQNHAQHHNLVQLQQQIDSLRAHLQAIEQNLPKVVAKEIFYESLSLQQRVDQFIFDANIELKTKIAKENE